MRFNVYDIHAQKRRKTNKRYKMSKELHVLAAYVHGALTALHAIGIVYNYKKGNRMDVLIHALAMAYDAKSVYHHYNEAKGIEAKVEEPWKGVDYSRL